MTKSLKRCIAAVVLTLLFCVSLLISRLLNKKESEFIEIVQDGKTLYSMDISEIEYKELMIESENGWNKILIEKGKIFVQAADCNDKTCCKMGYLDETHNPIVCLPHKLIIKYKE